MRGGFWKRHTWKFLLILTISIGLFGLGDVVSGSDADPAITLAVTGFTVDELRAANEPFATLIDFKDRLGGTNLIVVSLLWSAILLVPFRRGERWAWYAMWTLPVWSLGVAVSWLFVDLQPDTPIPPPAISGWVFFGLAAALLLGSRKAFFRAEDVVRDRLDDPRTN